MKKIYIKPSTLLTKVGVRHMICASDPNVTINQEGSIDAGKVESRRGFSIWDDEEE